MRTLILSDLHLGSVSRSDLLRHEDLREPLLQAVKDVDRVVLLGDVLELRHGPMREAMVAARPFFEDLGRALDGGEVLITAGNHDHALLEPWLAARGAAGEPAPLAAEQLIEPSEASPALAQIAAWCTPARVRVAYPGVWLREDVYAMHGHYLDCHLTVPTLERLSVAAMSRLLGRPADGFDCPGDYEAMGAPVFAWRDAVARDTRTGAALNGMATVNAWSALRGSSARSKKAGGRSASPLHQRLRRSLTRRAFRIAFPVATSVLNRAGLGPLKATISTEELRRAGLLAMGEVAARIGVVDAYVVFGHTHRTGPLPGDAEGEWRGRAGARLVNCGSWTYAPIFLTSEPGESPYWPGGCVLLEDSGPPTLLRLLQEHSHEQLKPSARA
ncbi:MAG TPA: metallophosphoesterase [Solirubrobacteraceae bacterium]|jgi:predicted phosphodiesterase